MEKILTHGRHSSYFGACAHTIPVNCVGYVTAAG